MAISVHAVGTVAVGTTSVVPTYPTWTFQNGDIALILVANKYPTNGPLPPDHVPTIADAQGSGGAGAAGIDLGTVYSTAYIFSCRGDESATTKTIAIASGNSACAVVLIIRPTTAGNLFDIKACNGADNSGGATSWSVTGNADPGFAANDLAVILSAINTDNYTYGSQAISATGATFGALAEHIDGGTSGGQDCGIHVCSFPVTGGPSSAAPVFTMTASSSATNNPAGSSVILRIREFTPSITWLSRADVGAAQGTTTLALTHHASIASGDLILAATATKYVAANTPTDFTLDANGSKQGGVGTTGIDTGQIFATVFYRTSNGTETGDVSVTITAGNSSSGQIVAFRPTTGYTWSLAFTNGSDDTGGAAYSATGASDLNLIAGDIVVCAQAINGNNDSFINFALTNSGVVFTAPKWIASLATANGDDSAFLVTCFYVLSGTSSGAPTLAGTLNAASANIAGPTVFVRIRAVAPVTDTGEWIGEYPAEKSRSPQWSTY